MEQGRLTVWRRSDGYVGWTRFVPEDTEQWTFTVLLTTCDIAEARERLEQELEKMKNVSSIPDRDFESMTTVDHPTRSGRRLILLIAKAGGGTVGRKYGGDWLYRVREAGRSGNVLVEGSDLKTMYAYPKTHEQALALLEDFLPGLLTKEED